MCYTLRLLDSWHSFSLSLSLFVENVAFPAKATVHRSDLPSRSGLLRRLLYIIVLAELSAPYAEGGHLS